MSKNFKIVIPMAVLGIALMISPANAENIGISNQIKTTISTETNIKIDNKSQFVSFLGEVTEINKDDKSNISVLVQEEGQSPMEGMVFHLNEKTLLFSDNSKDFISKDKLKKGSKVSVYYDKNTPTTMSLPAQLTPDVLVLNESKEPIFTKLGAFNSDLTSLNNDLKLNISDKTIIVDSKNKKIKELKLEDINNLLVFYDKETKSIPAQTSPVKIIVLGNEENITKENVSIFKDVDNDHWAKEEIEKFYKLGLIDSRKDNNFKPLSPISKKDFMFILGNLIDDIDSVPERPNETNIKLLDEKNLGNKEINKVLNRLEIGTTSKLRFDGEKDLEKEITRKEAAYLIDNVIKSTNELYDVSFADLNEKTDDELINSISYTNNILSLANRGIFLGFEDNTFRPDKLLSRAEAVVVLNRLLP